MYDQGRSADALDSDAAGLQEDAEVLHHVVGARETDRRRARNLRGRHEHVLDAGIRRFGHDDLRRVHRRGLHVIVVRFFIAGDRDSKLRQGVDVRPETALAQVASARARELKGPDEMRQGRDEHRDGARALS